MGSAELPLELLSRGCQRWNQGRDSYRPTREVLNPERYEVDLLDESQARSFVVTHHYSHSYPAARVRMGLYRLSRFKARQLCGVAVFSVPLSQAAVPKYAGVAPNAGVELGRFVLEDQVEANAESWFLARAFRGLLEVLPDIQVVLSYSDPVPRRSVCGETVLGGHVGTIYQAFNGRYLGRATPRTLILAPDGRIVSERALSKLRQDDQGAAYAYRLLRSMGAPARAPLESGSEYVSRALREGPFRRFRHPGNHVYIWPLGSKLAKRGLLSRFCPSLPYPKAA